MPVRYDQDTKAKAIRLVREHAGDYALDNFRRPGADTHPRMGEAVAVVQSKQLPGGWPMKVAASHRS